MVDNKLAATDVLAFRPGHLCDPPPWFIRELDFRVLKELANSLYTFILKCRSCKHR